MEIQTKPTRTGALPKRKRVINRAYRQRVAKLPCCGCNNRRNSTVSPHHRTGAGWALKDDDTSTMPLCVLCHDDFHDSRGVFFRWDKQLKKDWQDAMIAWTKRRLIAAEGVF